MTHLSPPLCTALLLAAVTTGCKKSSPNPAQPSATSSVAAASASAPVSAAPTVVRLSAFHDGTLLIDGAQMNEGDAMRVLSQLDPGRTVLWYYREGAKEVPHPIVQRILQTIAQLGIPISLSTQPDFSDVVDGNNQTRPRLKR